TSWIAVEQHCDGKSNTAVAARHSTAIVETQESEANFASSHSRLRGPGLNGDLSWSGVIMKLSARLLATASPHRVTPAVAATQHCLKPGCGPAFFRFGLGPNFFDTSLGLR